MLLNSIVAVVIIVIAIFTVKKYKMSMKYGCCGSADSQRNKNRAVLLVSFELDEIMSLSDRIEVIFDGQITGSVPGKDADEKELGFMMAGGKKTNE